MKKNTIIQFTFGLAVFTAGVYAQDIVRLAKREYEYWRHYRNIDEITFEIDRPDDLFYPNYDDIDSEEEPWIAWREDEELSDEYYGAVDPSEEEMFPEDEVKVIPGVRTLSAQDLGLGPVNPA